MIVSHRHKFIFVKTKKTAGTSIEIALSAICGPDDIITPIVAQDEALRQKLGFRGPQNYTHGDDDRYYYHHMSASEIRMKVGEAVWGEYFKFCFERNPWDKVISWYYWELQFSPGITLDDFIRSGRYADVGGPGGVDLYTADGKIIVDRVFLYERLREEWAFLAERFGSRLPDLPTTKAIFRKDRRPYRSVLSDSQRRAIEAAFHREIRLFGYEF